ncbi:MAG: hypothetical protein QNJ74_27485 [Trichodesmium sp. MO_231.B1]|nr:hypothetical protein [Trichodesmium sp. MO_231.B1]
MRQFKSLDLDELYGLYSNPKVMKYVGHFSYQLSVISYQLSVALVEAFGLTSGIFSFLLVD